MADTALSPYIGHISQTPEVPYCYYKLVTNVISAEKINVLSYPWKTVYTTAVTQSAFRARTTQFMISDARTAESITTFRRHLKPHLFKEYLG